MWPGAVLILRKLKIETIYCKRPFPSSSHFGETKVNLKVTSWGPGPKRGALNTASPIPGAPPQCQQGLPAVASLLWRLQSISTSLWLQTPPSNSASVSPLHVGVVVEVHIPKHSGKLEMVVCNKSIQCQSLPALVSPWKSGSRDHLPDIDSLVKGPSFSPNSFGWRLTHPRQSRRIWEVKVMVPHR